VFGTGADLFKGKDPHGEDSGLVFPIYVSLWAWRSEAHAALGDFDQASAAADEALRMATEIKHMGSLAIACAWLGYVHVLRGHLDQAVPVLERGLALSREFDLVHMIKANALYLGQAYILLGERERGSGHLRHALEQSVVAFELQWTRYGSVTASALFAANRLGEARSTITAALETAAARHAQAYLPALLRLEAETVGDTDGYSARIARVEEGLRLATEFGMRPEVAHCRLLLGRLQQESGAPAAARESLEMAIAMYRQMDMPFWLEKAEGEAPRRRG